MSKMTLEQEEVRNQENNEYDEKKPPNFFLTAKKSYA